MHQFVLNQAQTFNCFKFKQTSSSEHQILFPSKINACDANCMEFIWRHFPIWFWSKIPVSFIWFSPLNWVAISISKNAARLFGKRHHFCLFNQFTCEKRSVLWTANERLSRIALERSERADGDSKSKSRNCMWTFGKRNAIAWWMGISYIR